MEPGGVIYVYPDVAFAVSLLMNALILWGTARINKLTAGWPRIMTGAVAGALYSFASAYPQLAILHSILPKLIFSIVMFSLTFTPLNLKRFVTGLAMFYGISFALGGFFIGILYFFESSPYYYQIKDFSRLVARYFFPVLLVTVLAYVLFTRFAGVLLQKRLTRALFRVPVKVMFGEAEIEVEALLDTGNQLQDPLSRAPVVVVEYRALKNIFPTEVKRAFEDKAEPDLMEVLDSLANTPWFTRFRVIPFTSLGRENGLLIGFRPDKLEVFSKGSTICTRDVIIGVYRQELSPEGDYRALLHPALLENAAA